MEPIVIDPDEDIDFSGVTREELLRKAAVAGLGLTAGGVLLSNAPAALAATPPRRGGTLRLAAIGAGAGEGLNPLTASNPINFLYTRALFDGLIRLGNPNKLEPGLAVGWTQNRDATVWEIRLRAGVTWHDGKPFTADDVIYTFQKRIADGTPPFTNIDGAGLRKVNPLLVRVPLKAPTARLFDSFYGGAAMIIQNGATDFTRPVGTGPFMYDSFTPGQRGTFKRNPNYWDGDKPYLNVLEIISITDDQARINALQSGQVDAIADVPFNLAKQLQQSKRFPVLRGHGSYYLFYMRTDVKPFNDVRVRQAMRLVADRQAIINGAFAGFGEVRNDLLAKGFRFYASSLPQRQQDIDQAKFLLKKAGRSDLRITFDVSAASSGFIPAASLYAQQAKKAGIQIKLNQVDPAAYFNPTLRYLKMPFAESGWPNSNVASFFRLALISKALYNETHWVSRNTDSLYARAVAEADVKKATPLWFALQKQQWDRGGNIVYAQPAELSARAPRVRGIVRGWFGIIGDMRFQDWWLA